MKFFAAVLSLFSLIACTTSFTQDFKTLRLGLDKQDVVEILGAPIRKDYHDEKDWWYYTGYDEGVKYEKMVVFKNNQMIYAGRVTAPPHTPNVDKIDAKNQAENEALELENERVRAKASGVPAAPSAIEEPSPEK